MCSEINAFVTHPRGALRIVDGCLNLPAVTDDARISEEALDVTAAHPRNSVNAEPTEHLTEPIALSQHGDPCETRLEPLETDLLEQPVGVRDGTTPFGVVVCHVQGVTATPPAPRGTGCVNREKVVIAQLRPRIVFRNDFDPPSDSWP